MVHTILQERFQIMDARFSYMCTTSCGRRNEIGLNSADLPRWRSHASRFTFLQIILSTLDICKAQSAESTSFSAYSQLRSHLRCSLALVARRKHHDISGGKEQANDTYCRMPDHRRRDIRREGKHAQKGCCLVGPELSKCDADCRYEFDLLSEILL